MGMLKKFFRRKPDAPAEANGSSYSSGAPPQFSQTFSGVPNTAPSDLRSPPGPAQIPYQPALPRAGSASADSHRHVLPGDSDSSSESLEHSPPSAAHPETLLHQPVARQNPVSTRPEFQQQHQQPQQPQQQQLQQPQQHAYQPHYAQQHDSQPAQQAASWSAHQHHHRSNQHAMAGPDPDRILHEAAATAAPVASHYHGADPQQQHSYQPIHHQATHSATHASAEQEEEFFDEIPDYEEPLAAPEQPREQRMPNPSVLPSVRPTVIQTSKPAAQQQAPSVPVVVKPVVSVVEAPAKPTPPPAPKPVPKLPSQEVNSTVLCMLGEMEANTDLVRELQIKVLKEELRLGKGSRHLERRRRESWPPRLDIDSIRALECAMDSRAADSPGVQSKHNSSATETSKHDELLGLDSTLPIKGRLAQLRQRWEGSTFVPLPKPVGTAVKPLAKSGGGGVVSKWAQAKASAEQQQQQQQQAGGGGSNSGAGAGAGAGGGRRESMKREAEREEEDAGSSLRLEALSLAVPAHAPHPLSPAHSGMPNFSSSSLAPAHSGMPNFSSSSLAAAAPHATAVAAPQSPPAAPAREERGSSDMFVIPDLQLDESPPDAAKSVPWPADERVESGATWPSAGKEEEEEAPLGARGSTRDNSLDSGGGGSGGHVTSGSSPAPDHVPSGLVASGYASLDAYAAAAGGGGSMAVAHAQRAHAPAHAQQQHSSLGPTPGPELSPPHHAFASSSGGGGMGGGMGVYGGAAPTSVEAYGYAEVPAAVSGYTSSADVGGVGSN
eukprot:CAMPEP_0181305698 /NCGR_PEP_ID=MMETSP1101-20121128/9881_1 /TAXON_ID=46948 /ORGANISM="Rhodomonas abbreviata, Strain Caron Lab Isolate" /LENGTH=777 /DNA_ID=CAMNT_0023411657 /DNA_START=209 /DNA_END=2539 /DNA_ORIENTATION=+